MGNKQSSEQDIPGENNGKRSSKDPEFVVTPGTNLESLLIGENENVFLRLGPEAMVLSTIPERKRLAGIRYHKILCWGHTSCSFQFRYYAENGELTTSKVHTKKGQEIEDKLMEIIQELMKKMDSVGINDEEFQKLLSIIEHDPEEALQYIRQVSLSRLFDVKQASEVVRLMGDLSPFDKIEAAVVLYEALMNPASFEELVDEFETEEDKENVRHRIESTKHKSKRR